MNDCTVEIEVFSVTPEVVIENLNPIEVEREADDISVEIEVFSTTPEVTVEKVNPIEVEIVPYGEKGDRGDPGPAGPPGDPGNIEAAVSAEVSVQLANFQDPGLTYSQAVASDIWTITHNFGFDPDVVVKSTSGEVVEGDVFYLDTNTVRLEFAFPMTGTARLN